MGIPSPSVPPVNPHALILGSRIRLATQLRVSYRLSPKWSILLSYRSVSANPTCRLIYQSTGDNNLFKSATDCSMDFVMHLVTAFPPAKQRLEEL